jgi:hypothetical protein
VIFTSKAQNALITAELRDPEPFRWPAIVCSRVGFQTQQVSAIERPNFETKPHRNPALETGCITGYQKDKRRRLTTKNLKRATSVS